MQAQKMIVVEYFWEILKMGLFLDQAGSKLAKKKKKSSGWAEL